MSDLTTPDDHLRDVHASGDAGHAHCARCVEEKAYAEASYHDRIRLKMRTMPRDQLPVAPERDDGTQWDDYEETHPAYALIGASRVSGTTLLAGSEFRHRNYMTIRIKRASLHRSLSHDRWSAGQEFIEVALSEAQWATFLSATNVGEGVPCTVRWEHTLGHVPGIKHLTDRRKQARDEVADQLKEAIASLDEIIADPRLTKAQKRKAEYARSHLSGNLDFILGSFDKHVEETVERAKIEVDAFITGAITRAGITALGGAPILLEDGLSE